MIEARRRDIDIILDNRVPSNERVPLDNSGLYLNRYLQNYNDVPIGTANEKITAQTHHLQNVASAGVPAGYDLALRRWKDQVSRLDGVVAQGTVTVHSRVVVGLGGESVLENALTVNRNWGMPLIPGSALKGLANHFLAQVLSGGDPDLRPAGLPADANPGDSLPLNRHGVLFGTTDNAAYVNWLDAWYDPPRNGAKPFVADVLTPHHPLYNSSRGEDPPWDFDDPNPVSFLAAQGAFHVAIQAPDAAIADFAFEVLARALDQAGIGAKTSSGYGRGTLVRIETPRTTPDAGQPGAGGVGGRDAFLAEIAAARGDDLQPRHANQWCVRLAQIDNPEDRLLIANAIYERWQNKVSVLRQMEKKSYAQDLLKLVGHTRGQGGAT